MKDKNQSSKNANNGLFVSAIKGRLDTQLDHWEYHHPQCNLYVQCANGVTKREGDIICDNVFGSEPCSLVLPSMNLGSLLITLVTGEKRGEDFISFNRHLQLVLIVNTAAKERWRVNLLNSERLLKELNLQNIACSSEEEVLRAFTAEEQNILRRTHHEDCILGLKRIYQSSLVFGWFLQSSEKMDDKSIQCQFVCKGGYDYNLIDEQLTFLSKALIQRCLHEASKGWISL